jgi:hypothetical protein
MTLLRVTAILESASICLKANDLYPHLTPEKAQELGNAKRHVMELAATMNAEIIGRDNWCNKEEYQSLY